MQATAERVVSSTQEQATASWINYLNQMRYYLLHLREHYPRHKMQFSSGGL